MTRSLGIQHQVKDAIEYNKRLRNRQTGCVSTVYCEKCGYANHDSLCICIGLNWGFICLHCNQQGLLHPMSEANIKWSTPNDFKSKNISFCNGTI